MRAAVRIALKDLKLRIRDRSAFILGLIAPMTLAFIFNLILGGALSGDGPGLDYGLVDGDGSQMSLVFGEVLASLEDADIITLERFQDLAAAEAALEAGEVRAFFGIPPGFGVAVETGGAPSVAVVGDADSPNATQIAASIARQFGTGVEAARLAVLATAEIMMSPPEVVVGQLTGDPASAATSYSLIGATAPVRQLNASTYFSAGMAVFFMFFTVQYGVIGLLEEEREGTMYRLLAAPIRRGSVVAGKALMSLLLGVVSMLVLAAATTTLMGADWGPVGGVALLIVAAVAAGVGLMGIGGAFARTPEGAGNLGSIVAVVLGLLGGVFFPLGQGDDLLARASLITPHAWFLRGLGDMAGGGSWTDALGPASVLLGFAVVSGAVSAWAFSKRLSR